MSTPEEGATPEGSGAPPPWLARAVRSGVWTLIGAVLVVLAGLWFANQARELIRMLLISLFLALSLEPAVLWLHEKRGWRRGTATGVILAGTLLAFTLLVIFMIPALGRGVNGITASIPHWIDELNRFGREHFHTTLVSTAGRDGSAHAASNINVYLKDHAGDLLGVAGGVLGAVFNIFTVALFTFYLTANGPQVRRALLVRMPKQRQEIALWTLNEAIRKTGGYLYSKGLLALINGSLLLVTLLIVGCPFALPIAMFASVVTAFIPIVGTYVGGVVPVVVTLASVGVGGAVAVVAEITVYQQLENYFIGPHISGKTMELNPGVALGAGLAGGAVGGFVGAFFALPTAAVIQSFLSTYSKRYELTESELTKLPEPRQPKPHGARRFGRRGHVQPGAAASTEATEPPAG